MSDVMARREEALSGIFAFEKKWISFFMLEKMKRVFDILVTAALLAL